jgi:hypothetical protein
MRGDARMMLFYTAHLNTKPGSSCESMAYPGLGTRGSEESKQKG